jgi:hypothetical protein
MSEATVLEKILDASSSDEHYHPAENCRVRLTKTSIERILKLADVAKEHGVASIRDWSGDVEWGCWCEESKTFSDEHGELSGYSFRSECDQVAIYSRDEWGTVQWTAYEKHANARVTSEEIELSELRAAIAEAGSAKGNEGTVKVVGAGQ